ncbi:hypothetical protein NPIL_112501 [Nephila pilipes]|uniref:Uncharacterized protein n=1 Tax=Nephila pilipes TaxID=299642 RepID=A0A8X6MX11_NEPPI|nr:hypothetical protein NPIL_112501 [Nephila pilipes]
MTSYRNKKEKRSEKARVIGCHKMYEWAHRIVWYTKGEDQTVAVTSGKNGCVLGKKPPADGRDPFTYSIEKLNLKRDSIFESKPETKGIKKLLRKPHYADVTSLKQYPKCNTSPQKENQQCPGARYSVNNTTTKLCSLSGQECRSLATNFISQ